jgi:type I restriction enzyme S subunit
MPWESIPLSGCLIAHEVGRANQINTADIQSVGRFPVVDQGQAYIAGYTDDTGRVIRDGLPYVIFGDHTRCFKYIDFPFVLGADGTKVLKPNTELFNARFFYYAVLALDIPSRGYNRHFTLLREKSIPRPEIDEQRRIAAVLSAVQRAIERQERLIALTAELKKALMHKLFTVGTRGEPLKQTEIGPVPEAWTESLLGTVVRFSSGGTPSREVSEYWAGGTIPWVKTTEIDYCAITKTEEQITQAGLDESSAKIFPVGTLLMAMYGQGVTRGRVGILGIAAATNQACAAIMPYFEEEISTGFLYYFLEFHYEDLRRRGHGANQTNLSLTLLKQFPLYYPKHREQQNITSVLRALDEKQAVHERGRTALTALFRSLLHQLMTAQIRVHKLDLSALEQAAQGPVGAV